VLPDELTVDIVEVPPGDPVEDPVVSGARVEDAAVEISVAAPPELVVSDEPNVPFGVVVWLAPAVDPVMAPDRAAGAE
jgi:hypothetical protein